jgi:hypothetical protein
MTFAIGSGHCYMFDASRVEHVACVIEEQGRKTLWNKFLPDWEEEDGGVQVRLLLD